MLKVEEDFKSCPNKKIISFLMKLRKSSKMGAVDKKTFKMLVDLIKMPNAKILNYTLSILANCCVKNIYRTMFMELGGLPHLILIVNTIENDSIMCRACRLVGNLALNTEVAKELCEKDTDLALLKVLERHENLSSDTLIMTFRAVNKLWSAAESKWKILPDNLMPLFIKCLNSDDEAVVKLTMESICIFTNCTGMTRKWKFTVSKELFIRLLELSNKENLESSVICCLSNLILYQGSSIWGYLEGSNIAEVFIKYLEKNCSINENICKAFYKLCSEGAIRSKVRLSGLLRKLVDMSSPSNIKKLLPIFYLFQYDLVTIAICSQNPKFVSTLIKNIQLPGSIQLLAVVSRLHPPVKELVLIENLDVIIKNKECNGILRNITRTGEFLKPILMSGKVWEIEKAGCTMEDVCNPDYTECLLIQLLSINDKKCKEDISLAVPFLVKPRNFELLYKLLAHHEVMATILHLLQKYSAEERVLATIIRLIKIFKYNYHEPDGFFQDFVGSEITRSTRNECTKVDYSNLEIVENLNCEANLITPQSDSNFEIVTFEFDNGSCVSANKTLICKNSPVLDSMLNGHFVEAGQERVRLQKCTDKSFLHLVNLLNGETNYSNIELEIYLELLSLTDRFLLTSLNNTLVNNLKINETGCSFIYEWYRSAGYTKNNYLIGRKIYEFLFSSAENLLSAMKIESCKVALVNEISQYFSSSLRDLL